MQETRTKYGSASKFFLPTHQMDPLGNITSIEYDTFHLLPTKTTAPLNTVIEAENDYRVLEGYLTIDPNRNRTQVEFDPLGMVIARALMGKEGQNEGETIEHPTARMEYDFYHYWRTGMAGANHPQPNFVRAKKREEHYTVDPNAKELESYVYSDGFGREIQTKMQAEPNPVTGMPRWVGDGWKIYNNKGWVVEQYEPFFSDTHEFEDEKQLGVSAKMTFDPLGRTIRTDLPDGSFSKVSFDPWHFTTWDGNDTVEFTDILGTLQNSQWYLEKSTGTPVEQDAAQKAFVHKETPFVVHVDMLGRSFLSIADNGTFGKYETRSEFDIQGNMTQITDPRGNIVFTYKYDLLQNPLHQWQMDSGERTTLLNAVGNPIKTWDSRSHLVEPKYDVLNRPTELWVTELRSNTKRLAEKTVYGESQTNPERVNLRGQIYQQYDGAGLVTYDAYDFKGNPLRSTRYILDDYKTPVDWSRRNVPAFTPDSRKILKI